MSLIPSSGEFITLDEAKAYVFDYRKQFPSATKGYFAGCEKINMILAQEDCIGLRIYNGYDDPDSATTLVILGVDAHQHDMTAGLILQKLVPCPSTCDITSPLYD